MCHYSSAKFIIRDGVGWDILGGFWVRRWELKLVKLPVEDKLSKRRSSSPLAVPAVSWLFSCKSSQPGLVVEHAGMSYRLGQWKVFDGWMDGRQMTQTQTDRPYYVMWLAKRRNRGLCLFASLTLFSLLSVLAHSYARLLEMSSPAVVGFTPFTASKHAGWILVLWALQDGRIAFTCPSLFTWTKTVWIPALTWSRWCKLYFSHYSSRLAVGLVWC